MQDHVPHPVMPGHKRAGHAPLVGVGPLEQRLDDGVAEGRGGKQGQTEGVNERRLRGGLQAIVQIGGQQVVGTVLSELLAPSYIWTLC